jgi:hypothetical protein
MLSNSTKIKTWTRPTTDHPERRKPKGQTMSSKMKNSMAVGIAAIVGVAGAFAIVTASPSWAAATLPNVAAVKAAASIKVTDVRYYRRGYGRQGYARHGYYGRGYYRRGYYGGGYYDPGAAAAAGVALGLFGAAAGAAAAPYYYGGPGYYGYPPY